MASNRKQPKRKTILNSDCLTGAPLVHGTLRLVVKGYNPRRPDLPVTYAPIDLHTRRPAAGKCDVNRMGSPAYSPQFQRYLATIADTGKRASLEFAWRYWWTAAWVESELYAHFDEEAVKVVLLIVRDQVQPEHAVAMSSLTLTDMQRELRRMRAHCRKVMRQITQRAA